MKEIITLTPEDMNSSVTELWNLLIKCDDDNTELAISSYLSNSTMIILY